MSEPRKATQAEIVLSVQTLAQFSHDTARARGKIDGTSNTGEELGIISRDVGRAIDAHKHGNKAGVAIHLINVVLRSFTLSVHIGADVGEMILRRALENAAKLKR